MTNDELAKVIEEIGMANAHEEWGMNVIGYVQEYRGAMVGGEGGDEWDFASIIARGAGDYRKDFEIAHGIAQALYQRVGSYDLRALDPDQRVIFGRHARAWACAIVRDDEDAVALYDAGENADEDPRTCNLNGLLVHMYG